MSASKHPAVPRPGGTEEERVRRCSWCGCSFLVGPEIEEKGLAAMRCPQCGAPLGAEDAAAQDSGEAVVQKRRLLAGAALVIAALLAAVLVLMGRSGAFAEKPLAEDAPIERLARYLTTDADGVKSYTVTAANFARFYETDSGDCEVRPGEDGPEIVPHLWLRYRLRPEFSQIVDAEKSAVTVRIEGAYTLTRIESVDWETGAVTLSGVSSTERIGGVQDIFIANGYPDAALKYDGVLKESAEGAAEIEIPLNRWSAGAWRLGGGRVKGPISPLTPEEYRDGFMWLPQLKQLRIAEAQGSLVLTGDPS